MLGDNTYDKKFYFKGGIIIAKIYIILAESSEFINIV